jgi:hypothetical protein
LSLQAPSGADLGPALEDECGREDDGYHRAESRAYSPPIPIPVTNRQSKKYQGANANAVATVATMYSAIVSMKSFLRP